MTELLPVAPTRPLGMSGIVISSIAWGMWRFAGEDVAAAARLVNTVLDCGIILLDTADVYGPDNGEPFGAAEALLGQVFAQDSSLRARMVLASKGGIVIGTPYDSSPPYIAEAIDASLRRLGTDHVDLWQIHRPDILTHPQEVARALEDAHRAGKIRAIGVSNHTVPQIEALRAFLTIPLVSTQPEFSPLELGPISSGELDQAMQHDLVVLAWSPLGGGRIGNPAPGRETEVAAALDRVAETFGVSRTAAAYSWIMAHPARPVPIIGSQRAERIAEANDAYKVKWTRTAWYDVLVASRGEALP